MHRWAVVPMTHRLQHIAVLQSSTLTKARLAPAEHVAQARDSKGDEATHSYVQTLSLLRAIPGSFCSSRRALFACASLTVQLCVCNKPRATLSVCHTRSAFCTRCTFRP